MAMDKSINLKTKLGRLNLKNPVITASGTFGYGAEYSEFVNLNNLGAIVVKGLSLKPMTGNPPPRIYETPCGMLNSIGLQNIGVKSFIGEKLPYLKRFDTKIIANILGNSIDEYVELAEELEAAGVDAVELNVSCPNVRKGGIMFGTNQKVMEDLVKNVRKKVGLPLITKLSPNVDDIKKFAKTAEHAGSDIISLINTIPGMGINIRTRQPRLANIIGGLSGPAIKPIALRMVWECHNVISIPIIGMGGIICAEDAIEFMLAGASAIAVGTANFVNPVVTQNIIDNIRAFMIEERISSIKALIGGLKC